MRELMLLGFIITAPLSSNAGQEGTAYRYAAEAFYQQSGLDTYVRREVEKRIPEEVRAVSGNVFLVAKTIQERKLVYSWTY